MRWTIAGWQDAALRTIRVHHSCVAGGGVRHPCLPERLDAAFLRRARPARPNARSPFLQRGAAPPPPLSPPPSCRFDDGDLPLHCDPMAFVCASFLSGFLRWKLSFIPSVKCTPRKKNKIFINFTSPLFKNKFLKCLKIYFEGNDVRCKM